MPISTGRLTARCHLGALGEGACWDVLSLRVSLPLILSVSSSISRDSRLTCAGSPLE
jgi:hypothetical protein